MKRHHAVYYSSCLNKLEFLLFDGIGDAYLRKNTYFCKKIPQAI